VGTPSGWLAMVRDSIRTCGPTYSAQRMVDEYHRKFYTPLAQRSAHLMEKNAAALKEVAGWKKQVQNAWNNVKVWVEAPHTAANQPLQLRSFVQAYGIPTETLRVELVVRRSSGDLEVVALQHAGQERDALLYTGSYLPVRPGSYEYGVRVRAIHPELSNPHEVAFVQWADTAAEELVKV
jgi:starch phosphorylase